MSYLRTPLKFSYTLTLSIVLVLSLLAAIWAAFHSARRLVAPVRDLAEATHAIAEGDYSKRLSVASDDELGFLVRSFNDMTRRLAGAREQTLRGQQQIEGQRAYLEAVLANLSSGVISMSADSIMRAINRTAGKSLGIDVQIKIIPNPRREAEEHYYNPAHTGLLDLGLEPHYLTDEVATGMLSFVLKYKDQIRQDYILPKVTWT